MTALHEDKVWVRQVGGVLLALHEAHDRRSGGGNPVAEHLPEISLALLSAYGRPAGELTSGSSPLAEGEAGEMARLLRKVYDGHVAGRDSMARHAHEVRASLRKAGLLPYADGRADKA